jgi:hypothetical protein
MLNHTFGVLWNFKTKGQTPEPINKAEPQNTKKKYNLMHIELHYTIKSQPKKKKKPKSCIDILILIESLYCSNVSLVDH